MTCTASLSAASFDDSLAEPELARLGRSCGEAAAAQVDELACQMQQASNLFVAAISQLRLHFGRVLAATGHAGDPQPACDELRAAMLALQAEDALEQSLLASVCRARHVAEGLRHMTPVLAGLAEQAHEQHGCTAASAWMPALQHASASLAASQSVSQPVQQQAITAGAIEIF